MNASIALPGQYIDRASIGIVTFEQHYGVSGVGSSRIRAHWLLAHWPEAELFRPDQRYRTLILQKTCRSAWTGGSSGFAA